MTTVTINDAITLHGEYQRGGRALQVDEGFFSDWYSLPDSKEQPRDRPVADGAFGIDRDWRSALPMSLSGWYRGSDWLATMNGLRRALADGAGVTVSVTDDDGPTSRTASVRRFKPQPNPAAKSFLFVAELLALDPNRYGATVAPSTGLPTSGSGYVWPALWPADWGSGGNPGRVVAENAGDMTTHPLLEVTGGMAAGVELVEITTGSYLRVERDIPATSTLFFDVRTGSAYLDIPANDVSSMLTRRDWQGFSIPGRGSRTIQLNALGATSGTPRLTVRYAPAY